MLFQFLKYITPIHYFNLPRKDGSTIFPLWQKLPDKIKKQISLDQQYSSSISAVKDAGFRAIHQGYIDNSPTLGFEGKISLKDEYRFVRKYFNPLWSYYILFIRLLSFHNPVKEIGAFIKTRKIKRLNIYQHPVTYHGWKNFKSKLLQQQPKVSVIIPTLNRYEYLKDVLHDLEKQDYQNFDVIIIDQSDNFNKDFYSNFHLNLHVIRQKEKALWLARNTAIKQSDAPFVLLFDDDSRVEKDWISNHLKALDFFQADISSGVSLSVIGAKIPETYRYFKISDQIDTGNVMINKNKVFPITGLFDRQFEKQRMGDGEFGLRAYLHGFLNISNPEAKRIHLKVGTGGLREMGSWDAVRPTKWFDPRPIPSVLYYYRKYYGTRLTIYALLKTVPPSLLPYKFKRNKLVMGLGFILIFLILPVVLFQVIKSWHLATKKLQEGDKIDRL